MVFYDDHCHLNHNLYKNVDEIIKRAEEAKVKTIICSGVNRPTNKEILNLSKKYSIVQASLGLYPLDLLNLGSNESGLAIQKNMRLDEEIEWIRKQRQNCISIGEVGLDYHWDKKRHSEQKKHFEKIIKLVEDICKPIVIHSRKAESDCLDLLESSTIKHIVLHSFGGGKKLIQRGIDLGYNFSIPAIINRARHFQMIAELVPITQLTTETDGPYLSPYPGKISEPAFVVDTVKKISEIKKITFKEAEKKIWQNYERIFTTKL